MKRSQLAAAVTAAAALITTAGTAHAITNDWVPDNEHPYVGLAVFYDADGVFSHRCSGSLIDERTFLTAGHCTDGAVTARVYFTQDAGAHYDPVTQLDPVSGYPETCANGAPTDPLCTTSDQLFNYGFDDFATFPDTHDAGIVILDEPMVLDEYGELPTVGVLDALATGPARNQAVFTVSGYGLTKTNPQFTESFRSRLMASSRINNLRSHNNDGFNLQTNGNGKGFGGTCSGDSGGPVLLGDTPSNLIVAVTSFGLNSWCRGTDFSYRIDRQEVLDWIAETSALADEPGID